MRDFTCSETLRVALRSKDPFLGGRAALTSLLWSPFSMRVEKQEVNPTDQLADPTLSVISDAGL